MRFCAPSGRMREISSRAEKIVCTTACAALATFECQLDVILLFSECTDIGHDAMRYAEGGFCVARAEWCELRYIAQERRRYLAEHKACVGFHDTSNCSRFCDTRVDPCECFAERFVERVYPLRLECEASRRFMSAHNPERRA